MPVCGAMGDEGRECVCGCEIDWEDGGFVNAI